MEEGRIVDVPNAVKVRKTVAVVSLTALNLLSRELEKCVIVTEEWCKNFKIIADQIRRDYHVPKDAKAEASEPTPQEPGSDDPFENLSIVSEEQEAA